MSDPAQTLAEATDQAAEARRRLSETSAELRARLSPSRLVRDARDRAADAGSAAARAGVAGAKRNAVGLLAAGAIAGLVLARHRIAGAFRRFKR